MARLSNLRDIEHLYATRGGLSYGEGVTQLEHAVQCAALAQEQGALPSLVVAAFLHDIGHLFADEQDAAQTDDRHEIAGARALGTLFGEAVRRPIALHVAAKRYLCLRDADYFRGLSSASQASLRLQGGPFNVAEASAFEAIAYWQDAIFLRRLDDMGKREELSGLGFGDFATVMRSQMISGAGT
jgi:phosphonate degradation associated HDIG domain protein